METIVIIDGNSLINRAFYATPPLNDTLGRPTNAVYAFTNILIKIFSEIKPAFLAVAFDERAKTFRHNLYEGYKASRKGMPDELAAQMPILKELLSVMGIQTLSKEGFEADDIIGSLCFNLPCKKIILTGDKDSLQLINEYTEVYLTKKGISELLKVNEEVLKNEFLLTPKQVVDFKALMGDASDEIPGVPGVGEKTALDLLSKYNSLDGVYENLDNIAGKLKEKLASGKESAYLSQRLATIINDCGFVYDINDFKYQFPFPQSVKGEFEKLKFKSLVAKEKFFTNEISAMPAATSDICETTDIADAEALGNLAARLMGISDVAVYIKNDIHLSDGKTEYTVKITDTFLPDALNIQTALFCLKDFFESDINKILFDAKSLMRYLQKFGITLNGVGCDIMLIQYVLSADGFDANAKCSAYSLLKLKEQYADKLKEENLAKVYEEIEFPLMFILFEMEKAGFKIDTDELDLLSKRFKFEAEKLAETIYYISGEKFNINSPKQLASVLFEKMGLKAGKKTKSGYSTDSDVLTGLADENEIISYILKHRQIMKLLGTYVEGIKPLIDPKGFVHTEFKQALTTTGRLSSVEPNLQNIPIREEEGREIRRMFVPKGKDRILISADYSQIELRLLAHFSQDPKLLDIYGSGGDIHALTASQIFNVLPDGVDDRMRREAKTVNFGIIYGISDFGLSQQLRIKPSRAKVYIEKYFEAYGKVKEYMQGNVALCREKGYAETITGRKRYINEIRSANFNIRSFGERAAMNMPLQGSAADIMKIALINVFDRMKREHLVSELILTVHDELVIDTVICEKETVKKILKEEMEGAVKLSVPLSVSFGEGANLYETK